MDIGFRSERDSGFTSGGVADDTFGLSTGPNGVVGYSMSNSVMPAQPTEALFMSLEGTFNDDDVAGVAESCITSVTLAYDPDSQGFFNLDTGACIDNGWVEPSVFVDVTYDSNEPIYGFQFDVSSDVEFLGASGGAAQDAAAGRQGAHGGGGLGACVEAGVGARRGGVAAQPDGQRDP